MHVNWVTLALQLINFAILVWLLQHFLYRPVLRIIDARRAAVEQQLGAATGARTEVSKQMAELQTQRDGIAAERAAALGAAAADAKRVREERREEAEREAAALLSQARNTLAREREEALEAARRAAFDLGADIAARLLQEAPEPLRSQAWLERIEQDLAALAPQRHAALLRELGPAGTLTVVTAVTLTGEQTDSWHTRLERALAPGIRTQFATDPKLVAGAELHFGGTTVRFTLQTAVQALRERVVQNVHGT